MLRAVQLEAHYSKGEILQLYLNLIPYGGNVEGVKSAALLYFQQPPDYLSLAQTVTLAIIPNRPTGLVLGKHNDGYSGGKKPVAAALSGGQNLFPKQDMARRAARAAGRAPPRGAGAGPAPGAAAGAAVSGPSHHQFHACSAASKPRPKTSRATTCAACTRWASPMRRCWSLITAPAPWKPTSGSADFGDAANQGQNDGVQAVRSPGSTLKPFLYALALDRGLLTPKQLLPDVPTNFHGYRPENFDKRCHGEVTVERALAYSLNIPAVSVLAELGVPTFTDKLRQAGFRRVARDAPHLGLSTILGGCGATLEELTNLYVTLANGGRYQR
ncbi:MAG: transglycosylase domain-containing protein [Hymenobacter sp.]